MRLIKGRSFYKEPWYGSYHSMIDRCYRKRPTITLSMEEEVLQFAKNGITLNCLRNGFIIPVLSRGCLWNGKMSMLAILLKIVFGQPQKNKRTIEEIRYGLNIREKDIQLASGRTS